MIPIVIYFSVAIFVYIHAVNRCNQNDLSREESISIIWTATLLWPIYLMMLFATFIIEFLSDFAPGLKK